MSVNTAIKEGGKHYFFGPVDYLRVETSNCQYALWVPERERQLGTKSIDKNGIYPASADGVYGWSSVSVNVPAQDGVSGEGDDGEQHYISPDPETEELVDEVIPSSIVVETPPTPPSSFFGGAYTDGDTIQKNGMVVKAYLESGELWTNESYPDGIIPNNEITLVPDKAAYEEGSDRTEYTADIDTSPVTQPIIAGYNVELTRLPESQIPSSVITIDIAAWKPMAFIEQTNIPDYTSTGRYTAIIATDESGAQVGNVTRINKRGDVRVEALIANNSYTYDGKTVYYTSWIQNSYFVSGAGFNTSDSSISDKHGQLAWVLRYGQRSEFGYGQTIATEWPRYGDGAVLSDTFNIVVRKGGESVNPGSVGT